MQTREPALPEHLVRQLKRLELRVRALRGIRTLAVVCLAVLGGTAVCLLLDWAWVLPANFRLGMLAGLAAFGAALGGAAILRAVFVRPTPAELAAIVDRANPQLGERLTATVELADPSVPAAFRGSIIMRESLLRETLTGVDAIDFTESVSAVRAFRLTVATAAAVLIFFFMSLLFPSGSRLLFARLFVPWGNFESASNLYFHIPGGDPSVARGADLEIVAQPRWRGAAGRLPHDVFLARAGDAGGSDSRRMEFDKTAGAYVTRMPQVLSGFDFEVRSGRARSRRYHVTVLEPPAIIGLSARIQPPAYTGIPPKTLDAVVGDVGVFEGSLVRLEMQFNKPVSRVKLEWTEAPAEPASPNERTSVPPDTRLPFPIPAIADDGLSATVQWSAASGGLFSIRLDDVEGLELTDDARRRLVIIRDQPPQLALAGDDEPRSVHPNEMLPIHVTATDDVGLAALELHYEVFGGDQQGEQGMLPLGRGQLGAKSIVHEFPFSPKAWNLKEGSLLSYRIRAADDRPVPGPNETWSKARVLTVDVNALPPQSIEAEQNRRALRERLEGIRNDLGRNRQELSDLERPSGNQVAEPAKDRLGEAPARLRDEQLELARRLESLAGDFRRQPIYSGLVERTQQAARQDLAASHAVLQGLAESPPEDRSPVIDKALAHLADAADKLTQVGDDFEKLADLEKELIELTRLAQSARQLSEDALEFERRLAEARSQLPPDQRNADNRQLSAEKQSLDDRQKRLSSELNGLLDRRPELLEAARQNQLKQLAGLATQAIDLAVPQEQLAESLSGEATGPSTANPEATAADTDRKTAQQNATSAPGSSGEPSAADVEAAQKRQEQLARESVALAIDAATTLGPDAGAAQQATELARRVAETSRNARAGELNRASQSASEAARHADETSRALARNPSGSSSTESESMSRHAASIAERELELAGLFGQLGRSTVGRQLARSSAQQRLADAARQLAGRFHDVAERLSQEPLNLDEPGEQASAAQRLTTDAQTAMHTAVSRITRKEFAAASDLGRQASADLREAASRAGEGGDTSETEMGPIPGDAASQIADAARHLRTARMRLEQSRADRATPRQLSESPEGNADRRDGQPESQQQASQDQQGQPSPSDASSGQKSDGSQSLQAAAAALSQAVNQLWPRDAGGAGERTDASSAQQPPSPGNAEADGNGGGVGASVEADVSELERRLENLSKRNWGQLPGTLRTEILQASGGDPNSVYARLIKLYFEEIARTQEPAR